MKNHAGRCRLSRKLDEEPRLRAMEDRLIRLFFEATTAATRSNRCSRCRLNVVLMLVHQCTGLARELVLGVSILCGAITLAKALVDTDALSLELHWSAVAPRLLHEALGRFTDGSLGVGLVGAFFTSGADGLPVDPLAEIIVQMRQGQRAKVIKVSTGARGVPPSRTNVERARREGILGEVDFAVLVGFSGCKDAALDTRKTAMKLKPAPGLENAKTDLSETGHEFFVVPGIALGQSHSKKKSGKEHRLLVAEANILIKQSDDRFTGKVTKWTRNRE